MSKDNSEEISTWENDQITKSQFFHQKLHEWKLIEIVDELDNIDGEKLDWNLSDLGISKEAWNKLIHRGIKPILVFAHPTVISSKSSRIIYYRLMSMVSQKSMSKVRLPTTNFESNSNSITEDKAKKISQHLNKIISILIEFDKELNPNELILWRGMGAGSQAQGSWQNVKGNAAEVLIKSFVAKRIFDVGLVSESIDCENASEVELKDGRILGFSSEPDIGFSRDSVIQIAVEIKGGIDPAGVLERFGAALKSLQEAKKENSNSITILLMESVSLTKEVSERIENSSDIDLFFTINDITNDPDKRQEFFDVLGI